MRSAFSALHPPFLRPDSLSPVDVVGDALMDTLLSRGAQDLSVSAVASVLQVTPQGLHQRLRRNRTDDSETSAAVLFRMASWAVADRWLDWVRETLVVIGSGAVPEIRLPETEDERLGVAVWLAWHEVARGRALGGDSVPCEVLASTREQERDLVEEGLRRAAGAAVSEQQVLAVLALGDGLRTQLVWPGSTLPIAVAREVMARQVAAVVSEVTRSAA